jgi:nucleotide-binding universal stress UspA family protein
MKTILIPAEDHDSMPAVLEAARLVAHAFGSYMEGFAVRPDAGTYVTVEPVSSLAIAGAYEADTARQVRAQFEAFMNEHKVPHGNKEPAALSWNWLREDAVEDSFIGSHGRVFDLIVLGRPGPDPQNPRTPPLETALFESGRPALIVPPVAPKVIGKNILVHWNRSMQQARTTEFALPFLRRAEKVTVLMIEGGTVSGPSGEQAAQHLRRNGIKSDALTVKSGSRGPGEIVLEHAATLGCDLLVKCAYTQSRLRQMIFGGATRHILANATLPVLMAH